MTNIVAKPLGVLYLFKQYTHGGLHFLSNYNICRDNNSNRNNDNIVLSNNKKEESTYISNLYINLLVVVK